MPVWDLLERWISDPFWWIGTHLLTVFGFGLCAFLIAKLFREHRAPPVTIAWLLGIVLVPYVGVPLYLLFGGRKLRGVEGHKAVLFPPPKTTPHTSKLATATERVLTTAGQPPARAGNRVEFLPDGQSAYHGLVNLVEKAERSIHLMTFILGADETGRSIIDLLAKKAAAGVDVRLLLDALGCFRTSGRFVDPLRQAGGKVGVFMPVLPLRRKWSANLRNHRKVLIVDETTAVVGGMNLANEYLGPEADPARWLDTGAVIEGPAVADLSRMFAGDWNFATNDSLSAADIDELDAVADDGEASALKSPSGGQLVQIAASGPDTPRDAIYEATFAAMAEARERIWLVTPYFVPDETLFKALTVQSRLATDVRIIVPARSNHLLADLARGHYLRELAAQGARVFLCPRMVHAKLMLFDRRVAAVGSANVDARSFYLNFETTALLYSPPAIAAVEHWMEQRMAESRAPSTAPIGLWRGAAESAASLVAPLL